MSDELRPCSFNIGDKVKHVDVGNRSAETIIGCVINRYGDYEYTLAEGIENGCPVYITTGVDEGFLTLVESARPLCPDTLEAAANEKWQWWGGSDEEYYEAGPYGCRDEAIEVIVDEGDYDEGFHIIEAVKHSLKFDARELIEDQYFEKEDYFSGDRCEADRKGDHVSADKELQKLLDDWVVKHQSTFVKPDMFSHCRNAEFIDAQTIRKLKGEL